MGLGRSLSGFGTTRARSYQASVVVVTQPTAAAVAAAIARLPAAGGEIVLPGGTINFSSPFPSLSGRRSIKIRGKGSPSNGFGTGTVIQYTASGTTPFIDVTQSMGVEFENVDIRYTNSGFTGHLIDARNLSGLSANDTRDLKFTRSNIGDNPTAAVRTAQSLLRVNKSHSIIVDDCWLWGAQNLIWGREAGGYSINFAMVGGGLQNSTDAHVRNAGEAWTFDRVAIEARFDGKAGFYTHDAGVASTALTLTGCWAGDVATGGGAWITWLGTGLYIFGGIWKHETGSSSLIVLDENNCNDIQVRTYVSSAASVIDFGTTTGHTQILVDSYLGGVAAVFSGTVPSTARYRKSTGWSGVDVDGNIVMADSGSVISRAQSAATNDLILSRVAGDAADRLVVRPDGLLLGGGSTARDTFLQRSQAGVFKITSAIQLTAIAAASVPNNTIFLDSADNVIKRKDNTGAVAAI
jgi:hypothetical protein